MLNSKYLPARPGLLVSVRNVEEATTALAAGAGRDRREGTEPRFTRSSRRKRHRGGGACCRRSCARYRGPRRTCRHFTRSTTQAAGDTSRYLVVQNRPRRVRPVVRLAGEVARCGRRNPPLRDTDDPQPVAVVYADWKAAGAPAPEDVLRAATKLRCPALLVDTWDKSSGALFDHWLIEDLRAFMASVRAGILKSFWRARSQGRVLRKPSPCVRTLLPFARPRASGVAQVKWLRNVCAIEGND